MNYIFNQFRGLGDILFIMKIAQEQVEKGNKVLFPVEPHYLEIAKHFPGVGFVDKNKINLPYKSQQEQNIELNGETWRIIPFRFANDILDVPYTECMKAKYWFWDFYVNSFLSENFRQQDNWKRWREYKIERMPETERTLYDYLNPNNENFILVNKNFRTNFSGKGESKS